MDNVLFDKSISPDTRLMKFAHECIRAFRGQEPPYDAMEVELLVFCLRSALQAQRERDAHAVEATAYPRSEGDYDTWRAAMLMRDYCAAAIRAQP